MAPNKEKLITIPLNVVDRLTRVSANNQLALKIFEYFRPIAGQQKYPLGILNLFVTAIGEVTKTEPETNKKSVRMFLVLCIISWLEVMIDDEEALGQAIADYESVFEVKN